MACSCGKKGCSCGNAEFIAPMGALWQVYDELFSHRELTYDERDRLQEEKRKEYEAYFTERGATGDWYHFRQLSDNKQIVSIPYGKWNQDIRQNIGSNNVVFIGSDFLLHLLVVDQVAEDHMELIIRQMAKQEGVNEALKAADLLEWV